MNKTLVTPVSFFLPVTIVPMDLLILSIASLLAGFVDSIVGGGGLILVPALFAVAPTAHPATLLGINKGAAMGGTTFATWRYGRHVDYRWNSLLPAALAGFAASLLGAWLVTRLSPGFLRQMMPFLLLGVLVYTLAKKDMGNQHAPTLSGRAEAVVAASFAAVVGLYDGFFGPGAGSFFVFAFVRLLGYDFLHASASAKVLNMATNLAALAVFVSKGHIWWHYVGVMLVANVVGSLLGTQLALKHGTGFVRAAFVTVVACLILKTEYDAYFKVV